MGFWKSVSKALNPKTAGQAITGSSSNSNTLNQIIGGIRKTSPDMVDREIAHGTAEALRKTPIGEKDPLLAKQDRDTSGTGVEPNQLRSQLRVGGTIAAVVYTAGTYGSTAASGAGGEAAGGASTVAYEAGAAYDAGQVASTASTASKAGSFLSTAKQAVSVGQTAMGAVSLYNAATGKKEPVNIANSPARTAGYLGPDGRYVETVKTNKRGEAAAPDGEAGQGTDLFPLLALVAGASILGALR